MSCPECAGYSVPYCPLCDDPDFDEDSDNPILDEDKLEPYFYKGWVRGKEGGKAEECPDYECEEFRREWLIGYNEGINDALQKHEN
jgi:ribosome modulation factor